MASAGRYTNMLRIKMIEDGIDYILLDDADPHSSEYVSDYYKLRTLFSGFTGSNGVLLLGIDKAWLWTDGRYFIQAEKELEGTNIELMRMGEEGVPNIAEKIKELVETSDHMLKLVLCDRLLKYDSYRKIVEKCDPDKVRFRFDRREKMVREVMDNIECDIKYRKLTPKPLRVLDRRLYTNTVREHVASIRQNMKDKGADVYVSTELDSNMFIFNVRGDDISYNPVGYSYSIITQDSVRLYLYTEAVSKELKEFANAEEFEICDYDAFQNDIHGFEGNAKIMVDFKKCNTFVMESLKADDCILINDDAGVALMKAVKKTKEISNMKKAYLADSVAVCKFLYWLNTKDLDKEVITEYDAACKMDEIRLATEGCFGLSFTTISAYGANAAMMHYEAKKDECSRLLPKGMYLLDCGGQYEGATTDVTRTVALGECTKEEKSDFTRVVRGMLALQNAVFLKGITGINLDILARGPMWENMMDYKCGTGHGIGYMLNVHEGPQAIRWKANANGPDVKIEPGMIVSDEPGVYKEGKHGIRIENILLCVEKGTSADGTFYAFEPLTYVPIDMRLIVKEEMQDKELKWLSDYHWKVKDMIEPYLTEEEQVWLRNKTIFA